MRKSYFCLKYKVLHTMKKLLALGIFSMFLLQSCDDGDVVYENLDFGTSQVQKCIDKNFYFKTMGNEIMILSIPVDSLMKTSTHLEELVNDQNKVNYRKYSGDTHKGLICDPLPPANPSVVSELVAQNGGKIIIDKRITPTVNESNKTANISYSYTFNFENIKFKNDQDELKFEKLNFGNYVSTTLNFNLDFTKKGEAQNLPKEAFQCSDKNTIVAINGRETVLINLAQNFTFPTIEGTQTFPINEANQVVYKMYRNGALNSKDICEFDGNITSSRNNLLERWIAKSGVMEITTRKTQPKNENDKAKWHYTITVIEAPFHKQIDASSMSETSFKFERFIFGALTGNDVE